MSMSLTGRHHDWLPLAMSSIRPNAIQARYGIEGRSLSGEGKRRDGQDKSFLLGTLCSVSAC